MADAPALQVLVVTDNAAVRDELELGFPDEVEVVGALEARDAWAWLDEHVPSSVVVDLQTGSAGGFGLARDMKQSSRLGSVPVVILLDRYQDEWLAHQAGADAIFVKPFEADALLGAIRSVIASPAA